MARNWERIVKALMAKAADPSVEKDERETFIQKAIKIVQKQGFDKAILEEKQAVKEDITSFKATFSNPYGNNKKRLFCAIALNLNCRVIGIGNSISHIFGMPSDIENVKFLYSVLLLDATSSFAHYNIPSYMNKKSATVGWWAGYASMISERLAAANKEAMAESAPGTALVLVTRAERTDKAVSVVYPRLVKRAATRVNASAYSSGRVAGSKANLHNNAPVKQHFHKEIG
jgi:hypothetical protein